MPASTLTRPKTATPAEWLAARLDLLRAEKELTRQESAVKPSG